MTNGKKLAIVALLGVNVALLVGLAHVNTSKAEAAPIPSTNYLLVTGAVGDRWDAVYVVDLGNERLAAWKFDRTNKKLTPIGGRRLPEDFGGRER